MDGISRSRGWGKEIPHSVLPMEQLVLSDKLARKNCLTWVKHSIPLSGVQEISFTINEPRHETSNNLVCAISKASDQPAHMRSLIRVFANRLNIL